jgi:hypothetical protein
VYLYGSWRGLPYPSFLDLVFQGHIVILGSRRLGIFCMMFLGSAHLYHELQFLLLLGISAELHKRKLSLFHQIAMSENVSIREIAWRQYNAGRSASFFVRIDGILDLYKFISPFKLFSNLCKM